MAKLRLTLACDVYDQLQPLRDGRVQPEGLDLTILNVSGAVRHGRMYRYGEYDASEFSLSTYLVARSQGLDWLEAIPFFPRRIWCHEFCFLRPGSGVEGPSDLRGRRFGIPDWETTSALMTKGMLMHDYGVPLEDVIWVCAGTETALRALPGHLSIERVAGKRLEELLAAGEIDGALDPHPPQGWLRGEGAERLFPNYDEEERTYFQRTRVFPIMHTVVVKREILDRHPWVASSLYDAFAESRRRAVADAMQGPHRMLLAWGRSYLQEERQRFGRDPFVQGLKGNRHDLETMIQFAAEQGMLATPLVADELFAENTRGT